LKLPAHIGIALSSFTLVLLTSPALADQPVKKSKSGYCHYHTSDFYDRTHHFTAFDTVGACIRAQGKIPPGPTSDNPNTDIVKFSSTGICHDKNSEFFEKTRNYIAMKSLDECINQGGRLPLNYGEGNE